MPAARKGVGLPAYGSVQKDALPGPSQSGTLQWRDSCGAAGKNIYRYGDEFAQASHLIP